MTNFMFNEIETVEVPCNGCFWGGVGAVLAGVGPVSYTHLRAHET